MTLREYLDRIEQQATENGYIDLPVVGAGMSSNNEMLVFVVGDESYQNHYPKDFIAGANVIKRE